MIRPIVRDPIFLARKSVPAGAEDAETALDLLDTLKAHREDCRARGVEPLPLVSGPFRRFSPRLACRATARLLSSGQKSLENYSPTSAQQFLRSSFASRLGESRRQYLQYYQGAQRRIGGNEPAVTGRGSPPLAPGMAANMIGVSKRIIVFVNGDEYVTMYNPELLRREGPFEAEEGCLSLPGTRKTRRYRSVKVRYQNEQTQVRLKTFTGWTAQIIQHEIDHLDGILI